MIDWPGHQEEFSERAFLDSVGFGVALAASSNQGMTRPQLPIDASAQIAEASLRQITNSLPPANQQKLAMAMLAISLSGVNAGADGSNTPYDSVHRASPK